MPEGCAADVVAASVEPVQASRRRRGPRRGVGAGAADGATSAEW